MPLKTAEFKQLYRKRGIVEQRLSSFVKFIDSIKSVPINDLSEEQISEVELNVQRTENILAEFDEVQMLIDMNCHDDVIQEEYAHREKIETIFSKNLSNAKTILKRNDFHDSDSTGSRTSKRNMIQTNQNLSGLEAVKLPPIKLPVFNADYLKWIEFKDTFEALIHNNKVLTDIQKYHYLRASLIDEALKIIQSLDFSAQNYSCAWQTLCSRFDNSRMLVNNHMKALFEINILVKESANGLRNLIDTVNKHLCALKTLHLPIEHWDAIIIHLVTGKLDKTSSREWAKFKCDKSLPKLGEFFDFLKNRANFLKTIELNGLSNSIFKQENRGKKYSRSLLLNNGNNKSCNFCKENHLIYSCKKFLSLPIAKRWQQIKNLKLCCNCLCTGHFSKKCQLFGCKICKSKHSSLLHENKGSDNTFVKKGTAIVPKITDNLPSYSFDISKWKIPSNVVLADDSFNVNNEVDILIDSSLFWNILSEGRIDIGKNLPSLQNTVFGFIVIGKIPYSKKNVKCHFSMQPLQQFDTDELQKFWSLEEPKVSNLQSEEDIYCEEHFKNSVSRADNGQFIVKIPWKEEPSDLGGSKSQAIKRLLNLEERFKRNPEYQERYVAFINEYMDLGHMTIDFNSDSDSDVGRRSYFLPHHGVVRNKSLTTKLRVVFDGSAPSSNGKSLNDIQYPGPAIQNDILSILIRFRQHKVVVASDISKMYRIVLMHPDDRDMHRIVWRDDPSQPILTYRLNTVTYGTASAPFLAMRCIQQLAFENKENYPEASEIILRDFYVDDLITGFSGDSDAVKTCDQIIKILRSACFELRKWTSNSQEVVNHFQDKSDSLRVLNFGDNSTIKTLGVQWFSKLDVLSFHVDSVELSSVVTKRSMRSTIAKIYDPLGLASCCIILVKIMIQSLWSLKLDWDSEVPPDLCIKWRQFQSKLNCLNNLKIPRFVLSNKAVSIELHGFCDASQHAYCAAIYVRCIDSQGQIKVQLLCAKTKVAPVKILTIPRLELCGSLLLVQLMKTVSKSVTFKFESYYWCDSKIVLYWLNTSPANLQVFVGNRVAEIQRSSHIENWNYVSSKENPTDLGSRGMLPDQLEHCQLWFNGPSFLLTDFEKPHFRDLPTISEIPEVKKISKAMIIIKNDLCSIFERFSNLNKLIRVVAYCHRYVFNLKLDSSRRNLGPISAVEFNISKLFLVKLAQEESFSGEISLLKGDKPLPSTNRLLSLTPFLDENELLRVGGRLKKSSLNYNEKHPLLLDKKHKLSKLILAHEHIQLQHAGPQLLLASVRQNFWIISGMSLAKMAVKNCVRCYRFKPKPVTSIMADLPEHRVNISQPFSITGLDYAGPFLLKDRKGRGYKTYKAYICLFICFSTKAVHLELISCLTTEAFLAGLRRFVSRRGKPAHVYSDNGSNFVGSQRELKHLYDYLKYSQDEIVNACTSQNIVWHFIPPSTPNFGGLWESNVKGVKFHLYRVIGETILTYEEFNTFLVQIEATLNSRPLYPLSSDPNDYIPLTPSHFLIGRPLNSVPDPLFEESIRINQLSRFQLIQQLLHSFWKQWSKLYLIRNHFNKSMTNFKG